MNAQTPQAPVTRRLFLRSTAFVSVALLLAASSSSATEFRQVVPAPSSILLSASVEKVLPGTLRVQGEGFTPGGGVYISLVGSGLAAYSDSFWTNASEAIYGPHGSQDPARGYVAAGAIDEQVSFNSGPTYGPNGSQDPAQGYHEGRISFCFGTVEVQAFDAETRTWSNQVRVDLMC